MNVWTQRCAARDQSLIVLSEEADNIYIGFRVGLASNAFQVERKRKKEKGTHIFTIIAEEHTSHAIFVAHKMTRTPRTGACIVQSDNSLSRTRRKCASGFI